MAGLELANGRQVVKTNAAEAHYLPLTGHTSCVRRILSLPESDVVATACDDGHVRIYSTSDGQRVRQLNGHAARVFGLVGLAPDVIGTCSLDGEVRTWQLSTGEQIELAFADRVGCSAMASLTDDSFVVGTMGGSLVFYRHERGARLRDITRRRYGHTNRINAIDRAAGLLVTASGDRTAAVWNLSSWQRIGILPHQSRVYSCRIGTDFIATGAQDEFRLFDRRPPFHAHSVVQALHGVVWSVVPLEGGYVMSGGDDTIAFTQISSRTCVAKVRTAAVHVLGTSPLPDGRLAVCGKGRDTSNAIVTIPHEMAPLVRADAQFQRSNSPFLSPYYERPDNAAITSPPSSPTRSSRDPTSSRSVGSPHGTRAPLLSRDPRDSHASPLRRARKSPERARSGSRYPSSSRDPRPSPPLSRHRRDSPRDGRGAPSLSREARGAPLRPRESRGSPSKHHEARAMPSRREQRESPPRSRNSLESQPRSRDKREQPARVGRYSSTQSKSHFSPTEDIVSSERMYAPKATIARHCDNVSPAVSRCSLERPVVPSRDSSLEEPKAAPSDDAAAAMRLWGVRGASAQVAQGLEAGELAALMAAYMLRFRESWSAKFEALRICLHAFLDDNFINGEALVGHGAVDINDFYEGVVQALEKDEAVGAKMGLKNGVRRFYNALQK